MADQIQAEQPEAARVNVKMVPNPAPVEDLYFDGVGGVISRGGVVKLDLFRVAGYETEPKAELRQISHRLVLPLSALPDVLKLFQSVAKAAQQASAARQAPEAAGTVGQSPISGTADPMV